MAYKILVVDDEKMITDLLCDHLRDNGYQTYVANSAKEALKQLSVAPDLILLDIKMPWNCAKISGSMWYVLSSFSPPWPQSRIPLTVL